MWCIIWYCTFYGKTYVNPMANCMKCMAWPPSPRIAARLHKRRVHGDQLGFVRPLRLGGHQIPGRLLRHRLAAGSGVGFRLDGGSIPHGTPARTIPNHPEPSRAGLVRYRYHRAIGVDVRTQIGFARFRAKREGMRLLRSRLMFRCSRPPTGSPLTRNFA